MAKKRKDLSHTARCLDCGVYNEYDSLGTLVIRHTADCPQAVRTS